MIDFSNDPVFKKVIEKCRGPYRYMIVGILGTANSGKSNLCEAIAENLSGGIHNGKPMSINRLIDEDKSCLYITDRPEKIAKLNIDTDISREISNKNLSEFKYNFLFIDHAEINRTDIASSFRKYAILNTLSNPIAFLTIPAYHAPTSRGNRVLISGESTLQIDLLIKIHEDDHHLEITKDRYG